jgi:anthranilate synthase component II
MKILVLDNYDSFTYNLIHYVKELTDAQVDVFRNDMIALSEVAAYDKILLSPGPGIPSESGILLELIKQYAASKSIMGVCLGQQAIAEAFGGKLVNLDKVFHGVETEINITDTTEPLFKGVEDKFMAGRYHSWNVCEANLPTCLHITATDSNGLIMALRHKEFDVRGVQFHPESVLTPMGRTIVANWLAL